MVCPLTRGVAVASIGAWQVSRSQAEGTSVFRDFRDRPRFLPQDSLFLIPAHKKRGLSPDVGGSGFDWGVASFKWQVSRAQPEGPSVFKDLGDRPRFLPQILFFSISARKNVVCPLTWVAVAPIRGGKFQVASFKSTG